MARRPTNPAPEGGHIVAASILSIAIAAIYGRIAWGMFTGSNDFKSHIIMARRFYESGRPRSPHFLFHALTAGLFAADLASSFVLAGRIVMVACYLAIPLLLYALFWIVFRNSRLDRPWILFTAALAVLLAEPITLAHAYALGNFWPEPYQIPTSTLMKPFALASFAGAAWCLSHRGKLDGRLVGLFALATAAGALSKPSFLICILPAAAPIAAIRMLRKLPVSIASLTLGLYLPAALILGWQFYFTYLGHKSPGAYHDTIAWAPFKFFRFLATGLFSKFLCSTAFPLVTAILYWKQARRDTIFQLSVLTFLFGAFYSYVLVEKNRWSAGNFTWSGDISAFTLIVGSAIFSLRQVSGAPPGGWLDWRNSLCAAALALHALSGARMDWIYLTHYGCQIDIRTAILMCGT